MTDRVKNIYETIFENDRPEVVTWLEDHPEVRNSSRFSVYLEDQNKFVSIEDYLSAFGKKPEAKFDVLCGPNGNEVFRATMGDMREWLILNPPWNGYHVKVERYNHVFDVTVKEYLSEAYSICA